MARRARVFVAELESGGDHITTPTRLTHSEGNEIPAGWTLDSRSIIFVSNRAGSWGLYRQAVGDDAGQPLATGLSGVVAAISPDGKWLLYGHSSEQPASPDAQELSRVRIEGRGQPELVLSGPFGDRDVPRRRHQGVSCQSAPRTGNALSFHGRRRAERPRPRGRQRRCEPQCQLRVGFVWPTVPGSPFSNSADIESMSSRLPVTVRRILTSAVGQSLENLRWNASGTGFFAASRTPETLVLPVDRSPGPQ